MLNKKIILAIFFIGLVALSTASATENLTEDIVNIDETVQDITTTEYSQENFTENQESADAFSDLDYLISKTNSKDTLKLNKDYANDGNELHIKINKEITIDGQGHTLDANDASRIFYISGKVTLKNIVFINGNSNSNSGGAIYASSSSSLNIINSTFINCFGNYGGAVNSFSNDCRIIDSTFMNCYSNESGGAIYIASNLNLNNCSFIDCYSKFGGGIYLGLDSNSNIVASNFINCYSEKNGGGIFANSNTTIINSKFNNCYSEKNGGGINLNSDSHIINSHFINCSSKYGGGAYLHSNLTADITNSTFTNCFSESEGGGIYSHYDSIFYIFDSRFINCSSEYGGAVSLNEKSASQMSDSQFINCSSQYGGAIYLNNEAYAIISNSTFESNVAEVIGGGLYANNDNYVSLTRCNFTNGFAKLESGGAIAAFNSTVYCDYLEITECGSEFGGAITLLSSDSSIVYSKFRKNNATYYGGAILAMQGNLYCENNIFSQNTANKGGGIYISQTKATIKNNQFLDNFASSGAALYCMKNQSNIVNIYSGNSGCPESDFIEAYNNNLTITVDDYYQFKINDIDLTTIPSYYSLVENNLVTPVKDQGIEGNCWAFSAIAALESCILKASDLIFDLSEANLKNLMASYSDYGDNNLVNDGGNKNMVIGYLASWLGPIFDIDDIYFSNDYLSPLLKSILHIQNVLILERTDFTDNNAIKSAILKYGSVSTSMFFDYDYLNDDNVSYYFNGGTYSNHAACIVGWDDNYSKYNFKNTPSGNGAWIARNSWGPDWGDNGYFYVSYYDTAFAELNSEDSFTFVLNDTIKSNRVYQHEIERTGYITSESGRAYYKNIFIAQGNEYLTSVSTYAAEKCDYKVSIYVNDVLKTTKTGKADAGYYTVNLDELIYLDKNDNISVVFECNNFPSGKGYTPYSDKEDCANLYLENGMSCYWNGNAWADFYSRWNGTACIKMFTAFSTENKLNPYFNIESEKDYADYGFTIKVMLPKDATGIVIINASNRIYEINLTSSDSIKLYGLDENNNTLIAKYCGDENYLETTIIHVVDLNLPAPGSFEELEYLIKTVEKGAVLNLTNDYTFTDSNSALNITKSITIDGQGHTINANQMSGIFRIYAQNVILKNINFAGAKSENGGAILIYGAKCLIDNCTFSNNFADFGGAICWLADNGILTNSTFVNNNASYGGSIYLNCDFIKIIASKFINNGDCGYGGAILLNGENATVTNSEFIGNSAEYGGAIYWSNSQGNINNCTFTNNFAIKQGGAIILHKMGVLSNSTFEENGAKHGGAVFWVSDNGTLTNCQFIDNSADMGGAILWYGNNGSLINSTFTDNSNHKPIYWYNNQSGTIIGCKFINPTSNNVINKGAEFIKRNITLTHDSLPFEHNNPKGISITFINLLSDLPINTPILKISNGIITKQVNLTITGNVALLYEELFDLDIGIWNASLTTDEDDNYYSSKLTFTIQVNRPSSSLSLKADDGLTATVLNSNNRTINEGSITFYDNNEIISVVNVENGVAKINYTPKTAGEHTITAVYSSDYYLSSNDATTILVDGAKVEIIVNPETVGFNSIITVNVKGLYSIVNDGKVSIYIDDELIDKKAVVNGSASINYMPLTAKKYTLKAVFSESTRFLDDENTETFTVSKADSNIIVNGENGTKNQDLTLTAIITSSNNLIINEGTVTFKDGNTVIGSANVENGVAKLVYAPTTGGEHTITATFNSNNYLSSDNLDKIIVDAINVTVSTDVATVGYQSRLTANVVGLYSSINDGSVSFYLNNNFIGKNDVVNGIAVLDYTPLTAGTNVVKAVYTDSIKFSDEESSINCQVNPAKSQLTLNNANGVVGNYLTLNANIISPNNLVINEGTVTFMDDGKKIGEVNVVNGIASLRYAPHTAGSHIISASFTGNNYLSSNNVTGMNVEKAGTQIIFDEISDVYYSDSSKITISILSNNNRIKEGSVRIYVNAQEINKYFVENGKITFNYLSTSTGRFTIAAVFDESANYLSSNAATAFTVNKLPTAITSSGVTAVYNDGKYLVASLKDIKGNPLDNVMVTIKLSNGKTQNPITDKNGQVKFSTAGLSPNTYTATINFDGNENYELTSKSVKVIVSKATPKLTAAKKTFKKSVKTKKYTVTLKTNKNKVMKKAKVTLKVNGKTYTVKTSNQGKATFKIKNLKKKGTYKATVKFNGDKYYNKATKNVKIKIK